MTNFTDGINSFTVDRSLRRTVKPRTITFGFGDGYMQRIPDGINTLNETYTVAFNNRTAAEIDNIVDFLENLNGVTNFGFAPPHLGINTATTSFSGNTITSTGFSSTVLSPATPDRIVVVDSVSNDGSYIINKSFAATQNNTTLTVVESLSAEASTPNVQVLAAVAVICEDWSQVYKYDNIYSLTAQFKRVYES